ncbi:MAG: hypothetical protein ABIL11_17275 [Chloroflexota bacterium]
MRRIILIALFLLASTALSAGLTACSSAPAPTAALPTHHPNTDDYSDGYPDLDGHTDPNRHAVPNADIDPHCNPGCRALA